MRFMIKQIAPIILLLLCLFNATAAQPLDKVAAVVNDEVITDSELATEIEIWRRQLTAKKMPVPEDKILRKQVLQHLIDMILQLQLAKQNNINIDNKELDETINNIATTNKLSITQLRQEITRQGLSWIVFKDNIRKNLIINKLQQKAVSKDIRVSREQIEDYQKIAAQEDKNRLTYHLQNIVIPLTEDPTSDELMKAQQKARDLITKLKYGVDFHLLAIEESNNDFSIEVHDLGKKHLSELPEIFAQQVITMKVGDITGPVRTGNGYQVLKLLAIGDEELQHKVTKSHVRLILLKPDASLTTEAASKQAENLYHQLKSGKDFAQIATHYSMDPISAAKGGDLGWISPGDFSQEVEEVMQSLPLHKVSKPINTNFGWHLIEVLERKEVDDSVSYKQQQIRQFLQQKKFVEAIQNWQQYLRSTAYIDIINKELA